MTDAVPLLAELSGKCLRSPFWLSFLVGALHFSGWCPGCLFLAPSSSRWTELVGRGRGMLYFSAVSAFFGLIRK